MPRRSKKEPVNDPGGGEGAPNLYFKFIFRKHFHPATPTLPIKTRLNGARLRIARVLTPAPGVRPAAPPPRPLHWTPRFPIRPRHETLPMKPLCPLFGLAAALLLATAPLATAQPSSAAPAPVDALTDAPADTPATRRVAIFVKNRGGEALVGQRPVFEDLLIAQLTAQGFEIISPEDVTAALQTFSGQRPDSDKSGVEAQADAGQDLDTLLEQHTSALRLAQNLNADYILIGSLDSLDETTQHVKRPDLHIDRHVTTHKLLTTYKILDAGRGGSLFSGAASARARTMQSDTLHGSAHAFSDLMEDAAAQISDQLAVRGGANAVPERTLADARVGFTVACAVQDLSVPEVVKDDEGNYVLTGNRYQLEPLSVTVELDGVVVGSAPGTFEVFPGIHKLRLTREKFEPWERTINVYDGQTLQVSLAMTAEGRAEWQETAAMYEELKQSARGAESRTKIAEGIETMLKQSGYRVDTKDGVTVEQNMIENLQKAQ